MRPTYHPVHPFTALVLGLAAVLLATPSIAGAADRDGDGLRDGFERRHGMTSPDRRDSDWDGVVDSAEDSDGDSLSDRSEQRFGTSPALRDSDGDGTADGFEDHDGDGISNRHQQEQRPVPGRVRPALASAKQDRAAVSKRCVTPESSARLLRCREGDLRSRRTVVLLGDSHANVLLDPIGRAASAEGWLVVSMLKGSCLPLPGLMNVGSFEYDRGQRCRTWRRRAIGHIAAHPPDLLVITANDDAVLVFGDGRELPERRRAGRWRRALERLMEGLPARTELLVLGDVPDTWNQPVQCLKRHPRDMSRCVSRRKPPLQRPIEQIQREVVADHGQHFGTLHSKVCPSDPCPLVQGQVLVWRSRGHLSGTFARRLTPSLRKMLRGILERPRVSQAISRE